MKGSFAFAEDIFGQDSEFFMEDLAVGSLFTNITFVRLLITQTINICCNSLFENIVRV